MKKVEFFCQKKQKGITLIALVVTIVVLLILAGISISMLGGENGIITQAKKSRDETTLGEIKEEINVAWGKLYIDKNLEGIDINEQASRLKDILKEKDKKVQVTANAEEGKIEVTYRGYTTEIDTDKIARTVWKAGSGETKGDTYSNVYRSGFKWRYIFS